MKKMYKIAVESFDGERGSKFYTRSNLFDTPQKVQEYANATIKLNQWVSGEYQVIECTMDEIAFTYTEQPIAQYQVNNN